MTKLEKFYSEENRKLEKRLQDEYQKNDELQQNLVKERENSTDLMEMYKAEHEKLLKVQNLWEQLNNILLP